MPLGKLSPLGESKIGYTERWTGQVLGTSCLQYLKVYAVAFVYRLRLVYLAIA